MYVLKLARLLAACRTLLDLLDFVADRSATCQGKDLKI